MVVGRSDTGKVIRFQVFTISASSSRAGEPGGSYPRRATPAWTSSRWTTSPRAIWLASQHKDAAGRVFHLCSGPEHALPLTESPRSSGRPLRNGAYPSHGFGNCRLPGSAASWAWQAASSGGGRGGPCEACRILWRTWMNGSRLKTANLRSTSASTAWSCRTRGLPGKAMDYAAADSR